MASTQLAFDLIARDRASDKFDKIGRSASGATAKFKSFAKAGALAVGAAAVVAGKALYEMGQAAAADESAQQKLALQLRNSAKATDAQIASTEGWIAAQGKALGVTDDELRPALARLVTATKDVGEAQKLAALAMDVSAGTGKSLQSVTEALMKAQNGSVSGLSRLGIATKDAAGETKSFDAVMKDMAATFQGQAATAAETTEGKFKRLSVMLDETKEAIGARLLPIAVKLADWFLRVGVPALEKFSTWIGDKVGPMVVRLGKWIQNELIPPLKTLAERVMAGARKAFEQLSGSGDEFRNILKFVGQVVTNVVIPAVGWLAEKVLPVLGAQLRVSLKILSAIVDVARWVGEKLKAAFNKAADALSPLISRLQTAFSWMQKLQGREMVGTGGFSHGTPGNPYGTTSGSGGGGNTGSGAGTPDPPNSHQRSMVTTSRTSSRTSVDSGWNYRELADAIVAALRAGAPLVQLSDAGQGAFMRGVSV